MAELAAGASVAGLLSLTIALIEISHRYFSRLKNSTKTVKGYFRELEALQLLLSDFNTISTAHDSPSTVSAINGCHAELEQLRSKLQKRTNDQAFSSALHRLKWPFVEEETQHLTETIHRYLSIFHASLSLENARITSTTLEAIQKVETRVLDTERKDLLRSLSTIDPHSNHVAARDKHTTTTGTWFLESADFLEWLEQPHGAIWLVGIPGAGKTILCSTAINFLLQNRGVNDAVLIWYFDFSNEEKQTLQSLLRCLLRQACELLDEVPPSVVTALAEHGSRKVSNLDPKLLAGVLQEVLSEFESVSIVIDALDESSEVLQVLDALQAWLTPNFPNLKWLLTSRRKQEIEDELENLKVQAITLNDTLVGHDIRQHVADFLSRDPKLSSRPPRVKQQIERVLADKSKGMFRWVECQLQVLRGCRTAPAIKAALDSLPETLDITYERMLKSISYEDSGHARSALELLAFSKRPMRLEEVAEAVVIVSGCKGFDIDDRLFDPKDILSICAGLVDRVHETNELVLAHYSVKEFLLSGRLADKEAGFFWMEKHLADVRIAEMCLTYLISLDELGSLYQGIEDDYPFLEYASIYWLHHLPEGTTWMGSRLGNLVMNLLMRWDSGPRLDWTEFLDPDTFYDQWREYDELSAIQIMTCLGREDLGNLPHTRPHQFGKLRGCAYAVHRAMLRHKFELLKRLIHSGCPINLIALYDEAPLEFAVREGDRSMVESLLASGAKLTGPVGDPWNGGRVRNIIPLHSAVNSWTLNTALLPLLLAAGADPNEVDEGAVSVLAALFLRFESSEKALETARILIDAGADVNQCSSDLGSIIFTLLMELSYMQLFLYLDSLRVDCSSVEYGRPFLKHFDEKMAIKTALGSPWVNETKSEERSRYLAELPAIIKFLVARGADPNKRGRLNWTQTRTYYPRPGGWFTRAKLLPVEFKEHRDWVSPLQAACVLGFESVIIVRTLIECGADLTKSYPAGESPIELARAQGYLDAVKVLEDASADLIPPTKLPEASKLTNDPLERGGEPQREVEQQLSSEVPRAGSGTGGGPHATKQASSVPLNQAYRATTESKEPEGH